MPIPFIIAGVAVAAAGYGAKKGYDAKCDFDDAEYYNNKAKRIYDEAQSDLNSSREQTNLQMETLGGLKVSIYRESLADFINIFSKIKNVDFEDNLDLGLSISDEDYKNVLEIKKDILKITELVGGTTAAIGSGALAGFGAFGGAGMLATASTGTAIGSLSGVAATNATLAWFGGGSLAAGGLGMAGGMAVLGGIVAGPVIAVAGGMMAAKAETAKYEAEANLDKAKGYVEEMETAKVVVEEINTRVTEFINVLEPLNNEFENYIDSLEDIVDNNVDYSTYTEENKKVVMVTVSIAQTVKNICDVPIIDENGKITRKSKRALKTAKEFVSKLGKFKMSEAKALHQEIIDEIGTQTLARFGLNIFSLNTYNAYEQSTQGTMNVFDAYNKHKNNPNYFGQTFEDLDVMARNINSGLHNTGTSFSTTDNLGEVNHPVVDVVEQDQDGNRLKLYQHKVIKDSKGLFGKNNKYLENDKIVVASDDYEKHKNYLENMVKNTKDPETKKNAQELLSKLEKSKISRKESENARTTAVKIQATQAAYHVAQAGFSDAIVVALSTLANGTIYEIKDAFDSKGSNVSIEERIKRLLKKVIKEFNKTFKRGASFGAIDVGIGILSQIFKSISSKLKLVWKNLRASLKSIYNAIYSYITGEIKSYQELCSTIIKGLLSAVVVVGTVALESQLEAFLSPFVTPVVASFLAPALAIVIGSIAVVIMSKSVDLALNTLFGVFAQRDIAKMKAEKIRELYEELLPSLVEEREELKELIEKTYRERKLSFEKSFDEFKHGLSAKDIDNVICGLVGINEMYGKKLQFETKKEFDEFMVSNCNFSL